MKSHPSAQYFAIRDILFIRMGSIKWNQVKSSEIKSLLSNQMNKVFTGALSSLIGAPVIVESPRSSWHLSSWPLQASKSLLNGHQISLESFPVNKMYSLCFHWNQFLWNVASVGLTLDQRPASPFMKQIREVLRRGLNLDCFAKTDLFAPSEHNEDSSLKRPSPEHL